jgi:hypothetical protein
MEGTMKKRAKEVAKIARAIMTERGCQPFGNGWQRVVFQVADLCMIPWGHETELLEAYEECE